MYIVETRYRHSTTDMDNILLFPGEQGFSKSDLMNSHKNPTTILLTPQRHGNNDIQCFS